MKIGLSRRALRKNELSWRYLINLGPTIQYRFGAGERLSDLQLELLSNLREKGVAVSSIDGLFENEADYLELESAAAQLLDENSSRLADLRSKANDAESIGAKSFNVELLGSELEFDPESVFVRIALSKPLLGIANSYFRMRAKLRYYNVWNTFASTSSPRESQLWHVDREDNYILKVFLYLEDVDEGAGPFTYAVGTQRHGRNWPISPDSYLEGGVRRTTDDQMRFALPESEWLKCTGKKGTLILADTAGYHKGGEARTKDRVMFTCMYTSPASESKRLISFSRGFDPQKLDRAQRAALFV